MTTTASDRAQHTLYHFYDRTRLRIGKHVNPHKLAEIIIAEMEKAVPTDKLTFITRLDGGDTVRRVWRIDLDIGRHFIIFDHDLQVPVTVLPSKACIINKRGRKMRHLYLENYL